MVYKRKDIKCGKVYRIYDLREPSDTLYVGSTENDVCYRYANHIMCIRSTKKYRNHALYDHMMGGPDNFHWELLRQLENTTMELLRKSEQEFMDKLKPRFNRNRAVCLYENNKKLEWRMRSKKSYDKLGGIKVKCECGAMVTRKNLKKHTRCNKHQKLIALQKLKNLKI